MTFTFRTVSIAVSILIAGLLIGGAYVFSGTNPLAPNAANAGTTDDALKALAAKDADSDGLPNWEEALYGTNPSDAHSVDPKLTDKEAVDKGLVKPKFTSFAVPDASKSVTTGTSAGADTITGQFMAKFFVQYLAAQTAGGAAPDISSYVDQAIADLVAQNELVPPYTLGVLHTVGGGASALSTYATAAENAFAAVTVSYDESDIAFFYDGVTKNDAVALTKVAAIGNAYLGAAKALSKISVPSELASAHLALINAMALVGKGDTDMAALSKDPLRAMLGIGEYRDGVTALLVARNQLGEAYQQERVTLSQGAPGYFFYTFISNTPNTPAL